jgi:hypothetical protein
VGLATASALRALKTRGPGILVLVTLAVRVRDAVLVVDSVGEGDKELAEVADGVGVTLKDDELEGEEVCEAQAGGAPALTLGLALAPAAPTAVFRPHHCGSATVTSRSQPSADSELPCTADGAGPHTYVT